MVDNIIASRTLRALREAHGWDQQTLAARAGITSPVISRLERGLQVDLRVSVLMALARALEIPVDTLLNVADVPHQAEQTPELTAAIGRLQQLPLRKQKQAAAILQGYLSSLEDETEPNS